MNTPLLLSAPRLRLVSMPVDQIVVGKRRRRRDERLLRELNVVTKDVGGLPFPVIVTEHNRLIDGLHRLETAKAQGATHIMAVVIPHHTDLADLMQIVSGLFKEIGRLTALEKSEHIYGYEQILERLGRRAKKGQNQWSSTQYRTTKQNAVLWGLNESQYRKYLRIGRFLAGEPEILEKVRGSRVEDRLSNLLCILDAPKADRMRLTLHAVHGLRIVHPTPLTTTLGEAVPGANEAAQRLRACRLRPVIFQELKRTLLHLDNGQSLRVAECLTETGVTFFAPVKQLDLLSRNSECQPRPPEPGPVLSSVHARRNSALIKDVARLYLHKGDKIADITYGRGNFWKEIDTSEFEFHKSDLVMHNGDDVRGYFFDALPYESGYFDHVFFDPPYVIGIGTSFNRDRYRGLETTPHYTPQQMVQLYSDGISEAVRTIKPGGLLFVKCMNSHTGSRHFVLVNHVYDIAARLGLTNRDQFVFTRTDKKSLRKSGIQRHSLTNHSFLLVFKKRKGRGKRPVTDTETGTA